MLNESTATVVAVIDPECGDRLPSFTARGPVWVVDTARNKIAVERYRRDHAHRDYRETGAVTTFAAESPDDRLSSFLEILPIIEMHHGVSDGHEFVFPAGFNLVVIGVPFDGTVAAKLRQLGLSGIEKQAEGFVASVPEARAASRTP